MGYLFLPWTKLSGIWIDVGVKISISGGALHAISATPWPLGLLRKQHHASQGVFAARTAEKQACFQRSDSVQLQWNGKF